MKFSILLYLLIVSYSIFNLFFIIEAVTRLGWVVRTGEPLGSVLGLPLTPLLERVLPE